MSDGFQNIKFTGKGLAYFRICIVNFFLSIITLGVYSAWATVRTKKYLYGHTNLDGYAFRFHGTPVQILKGRLIAFALFVSYVICILFAPTVSFVFMLLVFCFIPWMIVQNLKFNSRMTSYRNIHFDFTGTIKDVFLYFLLYPFLSFFTLFLLLPWVVKKQKEFTLTNQKYGNYRFLAEFKTSAFYRAFGAFLLAFVLLVFIVSLISVSIYINHVQNLRLDRLHDFINNPLGSDPRMLEPTRLVGALLERYGETIIFMFLPYISIFLSSVIASSIYTATLWKHIINNTHIKNVVSFKSDITVFGFIGLSVTNLIAFVCTLGLAAPWLTIRSMRYLSTNTKYKIDS